MFIKVFISASLTENGAKNSMDQVKFMEESLESFIFFKGCLPQILFGPFLNILSQMIVITA